MEYADECCEHLCFSTTPLIDKLVCVDCGDNLVAGAVIATDNGCNMGCAGKATYVALVG